MTGLARSGFVAAKDTKFAGRFSHFSKSVIQVGGILGLHINKKLIFPGTTVDRAAFDLEEIHAVFRKGPKSREQ